MATTKDHTLPRAWTGHPRSSKSVSRSPWIGACNECNMLLGDKHIPDPDDRRAHIGYLLPIRYRQLLAGRAWTDEQIDDELEGSLRRFVRAEQERRRIVERRIAWAERSNTQIIESEPQSP